MVDPGSCPTVVGGKTHRELTRSQLVFLKGSRKRDDWPKPGKKALFLRQVEPVGTLKRADFCKHILIPL
jgi:hypothetical protein